MELSNKTFMDAVDALHLAYMNWELPDDSITIWKSILALAISDELLPVVILDWISHVTTPPKNPAEIIKYANEKIRKEYGNADSETELLIESSRNAYYASDDFLAFADVYADSFEAAISGKPAQEAYILDNIRKRSGSPNILIVVFDELKGDIQDCFTGNAERGIEFLRTQIKKSWNAKTVVVAKAFLTSGQTEVITSKNIPGLFSDGNPSNYLEA